MNDREASPRERRAEREATELLTDFMPGLEEPLHAAATYAILKLGDKTSAKAWMEYRVRRYLINLVQQLTDPQRPPGESLPPPMVLDPAQPHESARSGPPDTRPPSSAVRPAPEALAPMPPEALLPGAAADKAAADKAAADKAAADKAAADKAAADKAAAVKRAVTKSASPPRPNGSKPGPPRPSSTLRRDSLRSVASATKAAPPAAATVQEVVTSAPPPSDLDALLAGTLSKKQVASTPPRDSSRPSAPPSFQALLGSVHPQDSQRRASTRPPPPPSSSKAGAGEPLSATTEKTELVSPPSNRGREANTMIPPVAPSEADLFAPVAKRLKALDYAETTLEGAALLLDVIMDVIPSRAGLIHLYNPVTSEFVVASAEGANTTALESWATERTDPTIRATLREKTPLHRQAAANDPLFQKGRFAVLAPKKAVACSAGVRGGRPVGLIELVDPLEGAEFTRSQLNALADFSNAYADFIAARRSPTS